MPYAYQPTHLELEILPMGGWGYDTLPWSIRYARTLKKPYFTMTGRFHKSWGDFGGLRPLPALLYDCWNSVANGGTCSVGDHLHPRGKLDREVYAHIGMWRSHSAMAGRGSNAYTWRRPGRNWISMSEMNTPR